MELDINNIRLNIRNSSDSKMVEDLLEYLYGVDTSQNIYSYKSLFNKSFNNKSSVNRVDYSAFLSKVILEDYKKLNNIDFSTLLSDEEKIETHKRINTELLKTITKNDHIEFNSEDLYGVSSDNKTTTLILNVRGSDVFNILNSVYALLKDSKVPCSISIPFVKSFESGFVDSIKIRIPANELTKTVNLIHSLPIPTLNLLSKPAGFYADIDGIIGYDCYNSVTNSYESDALMDVLKSTITEFVDEIEKVEPAEHMDDGELVRDFRKKAQNRIVADLAIISRVVTVDPSNKSKLTDKVMEKINKINGNGMYVYVNNDREIELNNIYGEIPGDNFDLINADEPQEVKSVLEIPDDIPEYPKVIEVPKPTIEYENDKDKNHEAFMEVAASLAQDDEDNNLVLPNLEETKVENMPNEEVAKTTEIREDLEDSHENEHETMEKPVEETIVEKTVDETVEETTDVVEERKELTSQEKFNQSFQERGTSSEEYLDNLLKKALDNSKQNEPNDGFVREEGTIPKLSEEEARILSETLSEIEKSEKAITNALENLSSSLTETNESPKETETDDKTNISSEEIPEVKEDELTSSEISSLANNQLDAALIYERTKKYSGLVDDISVLKSKVPGTDFTLLDYFEQNSILTKIQPGNKYKLFTDEIRTGKEFINQCVINYVLTNGNVPLENIAAEFEISLTPIEEENKKSSKKGIFGLFKKKS